MSCKTGHEICTTGYRDIKQGNSRSCEVHVSNIEDALDKLRLCKINLV